MSIRPFIWIILAGFMTPCYTQSYFNTFIDNKYDDCLVLKPFYGIDSIIIPIAYYTNNNSSSSSLIKVSYNALDSEEYEYEMFDFYSNPYIKDSETTNYILGRKKDSTSTMYVKKLNESFRDLDELIMSKSGI